MMYMMFEVLAKMLWQLKRMRTRIKLWRMTRALGVRLSREQKEMVLQENIRPMMSNWLRRTGKTICATLWMFLHDPGYVTIEDLERHLPDPDLFVRTEPNYFRKVWAFQNAVQIKAKLEQKGIKISCTLVRPEKKKVTT